jgi:hypothetical protein
MRVESGDVIAGLRAQLLEAEREREVVKLEVARVTAELKAMREMLQQVSNAWRLLFRSLG